MQLGWCDFKERLYKLAARKAKLEVTIYKRAPFFLGEEIEMGENLALVRGILREACEFGITIGSRYLPFSTGTYSIVRIYEIGKDVFRPVLVIDRKKFKEITKVDGIIEWVDVIFGKKARRELEKKIERSERELLRRNIEFIKFALKHKNEAIKLLRKEFEDETVVKEIKERFEKAREMLMKVRKTRREELMSLAYNLAVDVGLYILLKKLRELKSKIGSKEETIRIAINSCEYRNLFLTGFQHGVVMRLLTETRTGKKFRDVLPKFL